MSKELNIPKDLCRCCYSKGSFKNLHTPYFTLNVEEVYSNMLQECLGVELIPGCSQECTICETCIRKLQDAARFKCQVQECERQFRNLHGKDISVSLMKSLKYNAKVASKVKRRVGRPRKHTVFLRNYEDIGTCNIDYTNKNIVDNANNNKSKTGLSYKGYEENCYSNNINKNISNCNINGEDIDYGNQNMEDISHRNENIGEEIGYNSKNREKIGCNNIDVREIGYRDKNLAEEISGSSKNMQDIGYGNKNFEEIDSNYRNMKPTGYSAMNVERIGSNYTLKSNNGIFGSSVDYDSDTPISQLPKEIADSKEKSMEESVHSNLDGPNTLICAPQYKVFGARPVSERKRIKLTCETVLRDTTVCPFRHHRSWFRCFYCTLDFMDIDKLRQHTLQSHTAEDIANVKRYPRSLQIDITHFSCKICDESLTDVRHMVEHFSKVHDKMVYKECIADYKVNTSPYTCHLCRKQYHVFRTLTTHLNEHYANYICDVCGKPFLNTKRLKVHKRTHENGIFPCTECGKVLKTKTSKANHMESHSKRVLKCHLCSKPMKHYNDRIKHMSEEHNITYKFKCVICGREYNIKHYLATHMRQTHGHKNKKCLECGMAFITNNGLKKHMLKHSGEKGYPCSVCGKAFARSYTLKEHMRGHEGGKVGQ